jgi:uncharacterized protein (TIGR02145 family)
VRTNCDTWKATIYDDIEGTSQDASSWLQVTLNSKTGNSVSGTDTGGLYDSADTLKFTATANTESTARTAYLHISADRLVYKVPVVQEPRALPFAYSNVYFDSSAGQLTFATEPDAVKQHYQGLFFHWGSLIGISPIGTFDINSSIIFRPTEYLGTPTGYSNIPYDNITASGNLTGFDATSGIGDVCRYISANGWVSGNWRMPTTDEFIEVANNHSWAKGTNISGQSDGTGAMNGGLIYASQYFFPDTYRRSGTSSGPLDNSVERGTYWTESTTTATTAHTFVLWSEEEHVTYSSSATKQYAFAVRCIQETQPLINVSPKSYNFTAVAGSQTFDIYTANLTGSPTVSSSDNTWCTPTLSGNTLTVNVSKNADSSSRTATITISASGTTATLTVTQDAVPQPQFAYGNICATSNTTLNFSNTPTASNQGIFFQWGSLFGVSPSSSDLHTAAYIVFTPSEYIGTAPATYATIPYDTGTTDLSGFDATKGIGDVCRYMSAKGWVSGSWRMPTRTEYQSLYNAGHSATGTWFDHGETDYHGGTAILLGYNFGSGTGQRFFPAAGFRNNDGTLFAGSTTDGSYWSASPSDSINSYFLYFNSVDTDPDVASLKQRANSVRCIQELNPYINVSPQSYTFTSEAGSQTFDVYTANLTDTPIVTSDNTWCTPTLSGNTLTVSVDVNMGTASRTATVTISASQTTATLPITQEVVGLPSCPWAYSNIYMKSDGTLTFATAPADSTEYRKQGIYFMRGSLIGLSPSSNDAWNGHMFIPSEYTGTTPSSSDDIPYDKGKSVLSGYNAAAGTGDICRYITAKGWVSGSWRMPTTEEYQNLVNAGKSVTGTWSAVSATDYDGSTEITSGYNFGSVHNQRFFPAAGYRISGLNDVGKHGYYWSASPYSDDFAYYVGFNSSGVSSSENGYKKNAYSVRCVVE